MRSLYIPVLNLDKQNFDKCNYDKETIDRLFVEHFLQTNEKIDRFTKMRLIGGNYKANTFWNVVSDYVTVDSTDNEYYMLMKTDALVMDRNGVEMDNRALMDIITNRKPSIILLDIPPEELDYDIAGELRFWMRESSTILNDPYLPKETKLKTLPKIHFKMDIDSYKIKLSGCKMIESYKTKNKPYKFAILTELITF